ncbi:hypothetical protein HY633_00255 [Candidatus Uhrbacteria bacterium]|nr:hypothetical protein [Candidatus Uhrbacteria bacterium]
MSRFRYRSAMVLAAATFFFGYSFLPLSAPHTFNSPDESANAYFASVFAESGRLWFLEALNFEGEDMIHPRSMRVVDHFTVPGGFLGLPLLYGAAAKAVGLGAIFYITPLLAVLAALAWGALAGRWFGARIGVFSGALLLAHPAWWYESARTLMPNVPFLALLIFGAAMFWLRPFSAYFARHAYRGLVAPYLDDIFAGMLVGLALFVRPSEAYWLAVGGLAAAVVLRRDLPWKRLIVAVVSMALAFAPTFILNQAIYGNPLASGYGSAFAGVSTEQPSAGRGSALLGSATPYLFPLGLAPRTALRNAFTYGIAFFPWWSALVAAALVALVRQARRRRPSKPAVAYAAVAAAVSCWLLLFYGSWIFHDNPDPGAVTIGSSYLRYWLPIFVFSTVPVAWLASAGLDRLPAKRRLAAAAIGLAAFFAVSAATVFTAPQEGLLAVRASLVGFEKTAAEIFELTPKKSLIVVDRADKFLFPERSVIVPLRSEATYRVVSKLRKTLPIFYYGITFPDEDLGYLNEIKLPPLGLGIEPVKAIGAETLYEFIAK